MSPGHPIGGMAAERAARAGSGLRRCRHLLTLLAALAAAVTLFGVPGSVPAQTADDGSTITADPDAITIEAVIGDAITTHPTVAGSEAELRAAEQALREARSGFFPTLSIDAGAGVGRTNNSTTRARTGRSAGGPADVTAFTADGSFIVDQLIYDGDQTINLAGAARARIEQATAGLANSQDVIALRAAIAYLDSLRIRLEIGISEENIGFHEDILEEVELRAETGAGNQADVAQAESRLARAQTTLVDIQGLLIVAEADFEEAVGYQVPADLAIPIPPALDLPEEIEDLVAIGLAGSPVVQQSADLVQALEREARAARGPLVPRVSVELSATREEEEAEVGGNTTELQALLRATWQLSTGGAEFARVRRALELESAASEQLRAQERTITRQIKVDLNELETSRRQLRRLSDRESAAQEVSESFALQFEAGRRSLLDLLDVQNELFEARIGLLRGEFRELAAIYRLLTTLGLLRDTLGIAGTAADDPRRPD